MFRNQPQGGSAAISMSVGPSLSTGVQSAFPIDVVPYGGSISGLIEINDDSVLPILGVPPAGKLYRLQRFVCLPTAGLEAELLDPATGGPYSWTTPESPVDNLMGQLASTALSVQIVGNSTPTQMSLTWDLVLIPTIS